MKIASWVRIVIIQSRTGRRPFGEPAAEMNTLAGVCS
jgi:hypothetical protein